MERNGGTGNDERMLRAIEFVYGELATAEEVEFRRRMAADPALREEVEGLAALKGRLDQVRHPQPPASAVEAVLAVAEGAAGRRSAQRGPGWLALLLRPQVGLGFAAILVTAVGLYMAQEATRPLEPGSVDEARELLKPAIRKKGADRKTTAATSTESATAVIAGSGVDPEDEPDEQWPSEEARHEATPVSSEASGREVVRGAGADIDSSPTDPTDFAASAVETTAPVPGPRTAVGPAAVPAKGTLALGDAKASKNGLAKGKEVGSSKTGDAVRELDLSDSGRHEKSGDTARASFDHDGEDEAEALLKGESRKKKSAEVPLRKEERVVADDIVAAEEASGMGGAYEREYVEKAPSMAGEEVEAPAPSDEDRLDVLTKDVAVALIAKEPARDKPEWGAPEDGGFVLDEGLSDGTAPDEGASMEPVCAALETDTTVMAPSSVDSGEASAEPMEVSVGGGEGDPEIVDEVLAREEQERKAEEELAMMAKTEGALEEEKRKELDVKMKQVETARKVHEEKEACEAKADAEVEPEKGESPAIPDCAALYDQVQSLADSGRVEESLQVLEAFSSGFCAGFVSDRAVRLQEAELLARSGKKEKAARVLMDLEEAAPLPEESKQLLEDLR